MHYGRITSMGLYPWNYGLTSRERPAFAMLTRQEIDDVDQ